MTNITAYFDRWEGSIEGLFTIQESYDGKVTKVFSQLPARSGQSAYTRTNWVRGKSPIPFSQQSKQNHWRLWTHSISQGQWAGERGIGEFFYISSGDDPLTMTDHRGHYRRAIGLHPENKIPGSAGCIVLVADTEEQRTEITALFEYLNNLSSPWIPLRVL